jgi:radical SAM enzyme (TIGR01210 family)
MSDDPETKSRRFDDHWVVARRGPKRRLDPMRPYAAIWEEEPDAAGALVPTAVVFLTNRECPFKCVMCDLWVNTLDASVPPGAIATQVRQALTQLPHARQVKLYNAGSFFDPLAVPADEDAAIAACVAHCERVIVEAHPAFLAGRFGDRCRRFRDRLHGRLEVAIGLETANPDVLAQLNKRMTLDTFARAAAFLSASDIDLRVFVLLNPPFMPAGESAQWTARSLDLAAASGATASSIIPTRRGNGAIEALGPEFAPPTLPGLEAALEYGLARAGMRVFADLWDVQRFFDCACSPARAARLQQMNRSQAVVPPVTCEACDVHV